MLTKKQKDLLLYIHEKMSEDDIPPSFEEMKEALGLKSKSGIHRLISALVERGYIERLPHRARALQIKRLPGDITQKQQAPTTGDITLDEVPLYGRIAAGTPIEAVRDEGETITLPQGFVGSGEHYALTVDGDSMIKAGIHDQDTVIIKRCDTARDGEIVVALVDDLEVTLKRIYKNGKQVTLQPENDDHEPRTLEANRVKIQGKLSSLLRTYH